MQPITPAYEKNDHPNNNIISEVINKYANTGVFIIKTSDPLLVKFYDIQLALAGVTSVRYPNFGQLWASQKLAKQTVSSLAMGDSDSAQQVHSIVSLSSIDGQTFSANAIGSLPVSAVNITQTLGIFDEAGNTTGSVQCTKNYIYAANCPIQAAGTFPENLKQTRYPVNIIYTFAQTINNQTVYGAEIITTQSYPKTIQNDSPTDLKRNSQIKICLSRQESDCDYFHSFDGNITVPIKGSITYFGKIDLKDGKPINAYNSIYLVRERQGGDPITPAGEFNFFNDAKTRINGNVLSWDLDWLKFKRHDFNSGERVYYIFKVTLQIEGANVASFITNAPGTIDPDQRFLNTYTLKPMQITYGCLGKGTPILMREGKEKAIDDIIIGEWVQSQDGRTLRVEDVIIGTEQTYLEIEFKDNRSRLKTLITSLGHPFCTNTGIKLASELTLDSQLLTSEGHCNIHRINKKNGEIEVYNLHLSTDDPIKDLTTSNSTMYAAGVLVGDSTMQYYYEEAYHHRPINILNQLPEEWRQDYQNHIDTIR
ncbi:Hint domain-containing protein [Pectobacterium versatile]|uniref:Hint domain-containing protein n=1 Tax=Pectobacterium versatile TaxID=2488639 RepID=UPI003825393B